MFRPMRRANREIPEEAAKHLLKQSRRGVLAVNGDDGYPFAIPVNYFYNQEQDKIYFHGAKSGHKVDALKKNDKVCFTVYGNEHFEPGDWAPLCAEHSGLWPLQAGRGCSRHRGPRAGTGPEVLSRQGRGGKRNRKSHQGRTALRDHDRTPDRQADPGKVKGLPARICVETEKTKRQRQHKSSSVFFR